MSLLTGIVDTSPLLGFLVKANEGMEDVLERIRNDLHPGQLAFVDDQSTSILGVSAG